MHTLPPNADLWVLAGQSNMAGAGAGEQYEEPSENVWLFSLRDRWEVAREPFWGERYEAHDEAFAIMRGEIPKHLADPQYRHRQAAGFVAEWLRTTSGAGPGLPFGKAMAAPVFGPCKV